MGTTRHGRSSAATGKLCRTLLGLASAVAAILAAPSDLQDASALGETRTLSFFHTHTNESATVTFKRNGSFDPEGLKQLNWLLRDWRLSRAADMDPRLFDVLWEVYREVGSREPIHVISAYRSPETNGMLRRASSGVADNSQHMLGKAMDIRLPDVDTARLRAAAMRLQYGGVGFYPSSGFVHVDTGNVRAWPRMSQDQLVRLFPDGKTVHLPTNGQPLAGYEQARAEILPRNAALAAQTSTRGIGGSIGSTLAALFGGSKGAEAEKAASALPTQVAAYAPVEGATLAQASALVPLPPRRPGGRPLEDRGSRYMVASLEPIAVGDEPKAAPAALRALFSPEPLDGAAQARPQVQASPQVKVAQVRTAPLTGSAAAIDVSAPAVAVRFSPNPVADLGRARFTGPAVRPLPRVVLADASL